MWSTNLNAQPKRRRSSNTSTASKKNQKAPKTTSHAIVSPIDTEFLLDTPSMEIPTDDSSSPLDNSNEDHYVCFLWDTSLQRAGFSMYSTQSGNLSIASCACTNINDCLWIASSLKQTIPTPVLILTSSTIPDVVRTELSTRILHSSTDNTPPSPSSVPIPAPIDTSDPPMNPSLPSSHLPTLPTTIHGTVPIKILKQQAFQVSTAYQIVNMLTTTEYIRHHSSPSSSSTLSNRLGSSFDFSDTLIVRTTAALVSFLVRSGILTEDIPGSDSSAVPTSSLPTNVSSSSSSSSSFPSHHRSIRLPGTIRILNLADFMFIDTLSFSALNIFSATDKTSSARSGSSSAHDFSLFTLLNHTYTGPGKQMLRNWLLRPTIDLEIINHRHDAVEFLRTALQQCPDIWKSMTKALQRIKDVSRILNRIATVRATFNDWYALESTALAGSMVRDALLTLASTVTVRSAATLRPNVSPLHLWMNMDTPASPGAPLLLRHLIMECNDQLGAMVTMLDGIIDWTSTREQGRMIPQTGLDTTLDDYRRLRDNMATTLTQLSQHELRRLPSLHSLAYTYLPQIGFVIAIGKEENGLHGPPSTASSSLSSHHHDRSSHPPGTADSSHTMLSSTSSLHIPSLQPIANHERVAATVPPDWTLCFETDTTLHYRNDQCLEFDNRYGDISSSIRELETSIIRQLENKIFDTYEPLLLALYNHLAEFDVLVAFAIVAEQYNYTRPRMVPEPVLYIKNGRHPLQEVTLPSHQSFIPNDIALAPHKPNTGPIAIITGPNYSGKSVYLKMVGILPIMAQIGCFIPAERAIMGYIDRVFSRIHSLESAVLVLQSSFTIDVNQVGFMLRHYTPRSLLLIDEFGKGTSSLDGVALLSATIRYLMRQANRSTPPPKTIITTHFREMFDHDLLTKNIVETGTNDALSMDGNPAPSYVTFLQMEVMFESAPSASSLSIVPSTVVSSSSSESSSLSTNDSFVSSSLLPNPDNVIPLFKLIIGQSLSSYGLACARRGGIPETLVLRAQSITETLRHRRSILRYTPYYTSVNSHGPNYTNTLLPVHRTTVLMTTETVRVSLPLSAYYRSLIFTDTLMRRSNWTEDVRTETSTEDDSVTGSTGESKNSTSSSSGGNGSPATEDIRKLIGCLDLPFTLG